MLLYVTKCQVTSFPTSNRVLLPRPTKFYSYGRINTSLRSQTNAKPFPAARARRTCGHMFFALSFCLSSNTNAIHYSNTHASLVTRC